MHLLANNSAVAGRRPPPRHPSPRTSRRRDPASERWDRGARRPTWTCG